VTGSPLTTRALGPQDAEAYRRTGWEAFGVPPDPVAAAARPPYAPGMRAWGTFDGERLVARIVDREYDSWFGGARVPTSGIAGVTVVAENRGGGMLGPLFEALFRNARERGVALSTLFPTAPRIYRRFGYEVIGQFDTVEIPTTSLAAVRETGALRTRRAVPGDVEAMRSVYDGWAAAQNGPLTRRGPSFPSTAEEILSSFTGVTLAVDGDDRVHGYASWRRGTGYGSDARMRVSDLVATRQGATRALLRVLGSFATVAPTTLLDTSGDDLVRYLLPTSGWHVVHSEPYMLRVLDPAVAFGLRTYPSGLDTEVVFELVDEFLADLDGRWRLTVRDGAAVCERTDAEPGPRFTGRGLALSYAGSQGCANLRMAGLLSGDDTHDRTWDALLGGRQVHVRDYF
jgi:predicted acetyltransferase